MGADFRAAENLTGQLPLQARERLFGEKAESHDARKLHKALGWATLALHLVHASTPQRGGSRRKALRAPVCNGTRRCGASIIVSDVVCAGEFV